LGFYDFESAASTVCLLSIQRVLPGPRESSSVLHMNDPHRNDDGLPRLFTYEHLRITYGWNRRTIENAVRLGKLRRPMMVGKRAAWTTKDIDEYLERLRGDLEKLAVDSPDDVPPDRVAAAHRALAARLAGVMGLQIAPDAITGFTFQPTDEQRAAAAAAAEAAAVDFCEMFGRLDTVRALLVAGGLMPILRPVVDQCLRQMKGVAPSETAEQLRDLAVDILLQARDGEFVGPEVADGRNEVRA